MTVHIIDWDKEIKLANTDKTVGIKITVLYKDNNRGTYLTVLDPGEAVTPHYHSEGEEEYHIISGSGLIRLLPANSLDNHLKLTCKPVESKNSFVIPPNVIHQLINNGHEPLTLIFSCPISHLQEDRVIIDQVEGDGNPFNTAIH